MDGKCVGYKIPRKRSQEAKCRRNKKKKRLQENKKRKWLLEKEKEIVLEEEVLSLRLENKILKRSVVDRKLAARVNKSSLSKRRSSMYDMQMSTCGSIIRKFNSTLINFKKSDVVLQDIIGCGVFGKVTRGFIKSIQQKVAAKCFSDNSANKQIFAEALVYRELSGHPMYPYFFGLADSKMILLELIEGSYTMGAILHDHSDKNIDWKMVCLDIIRAMSHLHEKGLIHNDFHSNNILLRSFRYVKIIDFGKCTLIETPTVYNIRPGSERQKRYNKYHAHLAYELRNIMGSKVSIKSDIYSIGYLFSKIALYFPVMKELSRSMMADLPDNRPTLPNILHVVSKF